jgi:hypothetical protein
MSIGAQYTNRVGVDNQAEGEVKVSVLGLSSATSKTGGKSCDFGIGSG